MGNNGRYWITIISTFVIPVLVYSYSQGIMHKSLDDVAKSVEKLSNKVDSLDSKVYVVKDGVKENTIILERVDRKVGEIDKDVVIHGQQIAVLNAKIE